MVARESAQAWAPGSEQAPALMWERGWTLAEESEPGLLRAEHPGWLKVWQPGR